QQFIDSLINSPIQAAEQQFIDSLINSPIQIEEQQLTDNLINSSIHTEEQQLIDSLINSPIQTEEQVINSLINSPIQIEEQLLIDSLVNINDIHLTTVFNNQLGISNLEYLINTESSSNNFGDNQLITSSFLNDSSTPLDFNNSYYF
ncbi:4281_t:CDS:1, partial [Acaulospora morrowiae]